MSRLNEPTLRFTSPSEAFSAAWTPAAVLPPHAIAGMLRLRRLWRLLGNGTAIPMETSNCEFVRDCGKSRRRNILDVGSKRSFTKPTMRPIQFYRPRAASVVHWRFRSCALRAYAGLALIPRNPFTHGIVDEHICAPTSRRKIASFLKCTLVWATAYGTSPPRFCLHTDRYA